MIKYEFEVIFTNEETLRVIQEAPTRSEARGWVKKELRKTGVSYSRIVSIRE